MHVSRTVVPARFQIKIQLTEVNRTLGRGYNQNVQYLTTIVDSDRWNL